MRENTRLRDLYRLSMEMCFHTEAGTCNNLPDNPWHWGNGKVRLTLGDRAAHRPFLLIPDSLSFWTQKYFPTFLCASPTGNFTTLVSVTDSQVIQQKNSCSLFQKAERLLGTACPAPLRPAAGMAMRLVYTNEMWVEVWGRHFQVIVF